MTQQADADLAAYLDGRMAFCSIATTSHVNLARACLTSLMRHNPEAASVLLLADPDQKAPHELAQGFYLRIADCIDPASLADMRQRYSPAELCFAAKPFLIAKLLAAGAAQVHYLDGDCYCYSTMESLSKELEAADMLLTPHCLQAVPDDGLTPRAITLLRAGTFNGGYIGVNNTAEGRRFVAWLGDMTRNQGYNRPDQGMCGDQRWLDLVPALFPGLAICRNASANVAYWNLQERPLEQDADGRYMVNGQPLIFFHFSGADSRAPEQLSHHQNRHSLAPNSTLSRLLAEYWSSIATPPPIHRGGLSRIREWLSRK